MDSLNDRSRQGKGLLLRKGFVLASSGTPFVPWGFNYDHEERGRLIEDYWDAECRELVWPLGWALRSVPEVELFICYEDREGEEPARQDWASPAELLAWRELDGGTFLTVLRDW
jgi:hypothetical protein